MIDFLFSFLLVPLEPALENPQTLYAGQLTEIVQRLDKSQEVHPALDPELFKPKPVVQPETPKGILLINTLPKPEEGKSPAGLSSEALATLSLTGVMQVGKGKVAILNDGVNDHVLALGSYLLNSMQVSFIGNDRIRLTPIQQTAESKDIELILQHANKKGSEQ